MVDKSSERFQEKDEERKQKQRTARQNRALHLFYKHLAEQLNQAGFDMKRTLRADVEIPWNPDTVKNYLWRPIQKAQLQKDSTTELTTRDIDAVTETLTRHLGDKLGISIAFPSIETLLDKEREAEYAHRSPHVS